MNILGVSNIGRKDTMHYQHEMDHPYQHYESPYEPGYDSPYMDHNTHKKQMYELCNKFHLYFVQIQAIDGQMYDGIIEDVDDDSVTLLMPYGDMDREVGTERQYGFGYSGYGGYGGYGGFGFPRRFRRFRRFRFPFFRLRRLFFPYYY